MATKKTTAKKATKKVATKTAAKKAVTKAPAKKAPVKKTAKKAPAKKTTQAPLTTVIALTDVGWGNTIYLRGEGAGLSWEEGVAMDHVDGAWTWSTTAAKDGLSFKFILNDEQWANGENLSVPAGGISESTPSFD